MWRRGTSSNYNSGTSFSRRVFKRNMALKLLNPVSRLSWKFWVLPAEISFIPTRDYAARKGTRERAKKRKIKVEEKKLEFIPHNLRKINVETSKIPKRVIDDDFPEPEDDVYIFKYYKAKRYSPAEAVECLKETHHPTMYNVPHAPLMVKVELNMVAEKKTRFIDDFKRMVTLPYPFAADKPRRTLVFCKTPELQQIAADAGADLVGGVEVIKDIQDGTVPLLGYNIFIAHPNIAAELAALRGLLKRKYPNPKMGSLGVDLPEMIDKFKRGLEYESKKDMNEHSYGSIDAKLGTLDMEVDELVANYIALINDINTLRPRREGSFITACYFTSSPSPENLRIEFENHLLVKEFVPLLKKTKAKLEEPDGAEKSAATG